ncbi:hypothetical protein XENOCAPTIV_027481, partial [Xenoophorus captivus]
PPLLGLIKPYKRANFIHPCYSPCVRAIYGPLGNPSSPVRAWWNGDTTPRLVGVTQCKCHRLQMRQTLPLLSIWLRSLTSPPPSFVHTYFSIDRPVTASNRHIN